MSLIRFPAAATLALAIISLPAIQAAAADAVRYRAQPRGSKMTVTGTSTAHDWSLNGEIIGGYVEFPADIMFDSSKSELAGAVNGKLNAKAEINIPVTSLKAPWEGMDEAMQDAMKASEFPRIQFRLVELNLKTPHAAGTPFAFEARGDLAVHGVTNTITMPVAIEKADGEKLKITGKVPMKMTDYKIAPPVKLGVFRTGDEIIVSFELIVAPPKAAKP